MQSAEGEVQEDRRRGERRPRMQLARVRAEGNPRVIGFSDGSIAEILAEALRLSSLGSHHLDNVAAALS